MVKAFVFLLSVASALWGTAFADDPVPVQWTAFRGSTSGVFYKPTDFYRHGLKKSFPEMEAINSEKIPFLDVMARHLESAGVPVLYGFDPNVEATFDLYGQVLNVTPFLPPENIGTHPEQVLGRLYMPEHDTGHHFAGIPGLRRADLAHLAETRQKLIDIIILKETFAVSQSSMVYIPSYGEWRDRVPANRVAEYRRYNQGYYSGMKPMTSAEQIEMSEAWTLGRTERYHQLLNEFASVSSLEATRRAGVRPMMPDFSKVIGQKLNDAFLSWIVRSFEAKLSRKRTVGYEGFVKYASALADFYLQPWLVGWSEDFGIGIPLDELHARTANLIDQARHFGMRNVVDPENVAHALDWDHAFLRTEIGLFARRVAEARVVVEADGNAKSKAMAELDRLYQEAKATHAVVSAGGELGAAKRRFLDIVADAEKNVPMDKIVSWSNRAPGVRYGRYWRDPYAYAVPRETLGGSHLAPTETSEALEQESRRQSRLWRWIENRKKRLIPGFEAGLERRRLKAELARRYDAFIAESRRGPRGAVPTTLETELRLFGQNFETLIHDSLLPQFSDLSVKGPEKLALERALRRLVTVTEAGLDKAILLGGTPEEGWWKTLDDALAATHQEWLSEAKSPQTLEKLTSRIDQAIGSLRDARLAAPGATASKTAFRTIAPPGFFSGPETLELVDFVAIGKDRSGAPARSMVRPFVSFQDWISARRVNECIADLRQPASGFEAEGF